MIAVCLLVLTASCSQQNTSQNPVDEDNDDSKMLVDEESKPSLELQYAAIKCLGLAWPSNESATQQKHILELMESLNIYSWDIFHWHLQTIRSEVKSNKDFKLYKSILIDTLEAETKHN